MDEMSIPLKRLRFLAWDRRWVKSRVRLRPGPIGAFIRTAMEKPMGMFGRQRRPSGDRHVVQSQCHDEQPEPVQTIRSTTSMFGSCGEQAFVAIRSRVFDPFWGGQAKYLI